MTSHPKTITKRLHQVKPRLVLRREYILLGFCIIVAGLFVLSPRLQSLSYGNIDPSYNYAVNNAAASKEAFGTQFIATYGPLAYLVSDYLPQNLDKITLWLGVYALLLGIGVYLFASLYLKAGKQRWLGAIGLLYVLAITIGGGTIEWGYLTVFLLYCSILIKISWRTRLILILPMAAAAAVLILTEFTVGLIALLSLLCVCLLSTENRINERFKQAALGLGTFLLVFVALGRYLGVGNFIQYIHTSLIESSNFSSAMSLYSTGTAYATLFVALTLLALLFWPLLHGKKAFIKYLFFAPTLLTIWKYAVVRQDAHVLRVLQVSIPVACIIYVTLKNKTIRDRWALVLILTLTSLAVWANELPFGGTNGFMAAITSPITNVKSFEFIHFFRLSKQKAQWASQSAAGLGGAALPKSIVTRIGDNKVDVFPWETSIIAANGLKWDNRPSPFSFETYDPYLDNLNAEFFKSKAAPKYIVWHSTGTQSVDSIDYRHILWDEPATFRAILHDYTLVDSDQQFMLLEKRSAGPFRFASQNTNLGKVPVSNRWITLNIAHPTDPLFAYFTVSESITDKLTTMALRGKLYYLSLKEKSGNIHEYRLIPENTNQGILINGLPTNWNNLVQFMQTKKLSSVSQSIVQIKLSASP